MEITIPSANVYANPLTGPVPNHIRTNAAIRVVMFPSKIALNAFEKPDLIEALTEFPAAISVIWAMTRSMSTTIFSI